MRRQFYTALKRVAHGWLPPPRLTVAEWADQNRVLSPEASSEPGRWRTERVEYMREIMQAFSDPDVETVVLRKSAQVGYTEILLNIIGYRMELDPGPMLMVQPTIDMAETISRDRISPMLRDTASLAGLVRDPRSRDGENRTLYKKFPGGHLTLAGANSPAGLASRPVRDILYDEVDRFPASAGSEGDPIAIADKRATTFWNRKRFIGSTPTVSAASRIEKAFAGSDRRYYHVPCPHCEHFHPIEWKNVKWDKNQSEMAHLVCPDCGVVIEDEDRPAMVAAGRWVATAPFRGVAGFHVWAGYSPWVSLEEIVSEFLRSKDDQELLQVWTNTVLGEAFDRGAGEEIADADELMARSEGDGIQEWAVPSWAALITVGVDTQDDRIAVEVWAWGPEKRCRLLHWSEIYGDPNDDDVWKDLDEVLDREFEHPDDYILPITVAAVDTGGHRTQAVYAYARKTGPRVMAIKGASTDSAPVIGRPSMQDVNFRGKPIAGGVALWSVGTKVIKDELSSRLKVERPGPRYVEFPSILPREFYDQLTGETLATRFKNGVPYLRWVPKTPKQRLESWDCWVYAYAAAVRAGMYRVDLEKLLEERKGLSKSTGKTAKKSQQRAAQSSFMKR